MTTFGTTDISYNVDTGKGRDLLCPQLYYAFQIALSRPYIFPRFTFFPAVFYFFNDLELLAFYSSILQTVFNQSVFFFESFLFHNIFFLRQK